MLGLYLEILIIGHKLYTMISILNEIALKKKSFWQVVMTNILFTEKKRNKNKTKTIPQPLSKPIIESGTSGNVD